MVRKILLAFLIVASTAGADVQRGHADPAFDKIPFEQWLGDHSPMAVRWRMRVPAAELSFHQRLMAPVEITIDGADLQPRRGNGELVFFLQITDGEGTHFRTHSSIDLSKLDSNVKAANIELSHDTFFLPGAYELAVVMLDTITGEHGAKRTQFRVAPAQSSFLLDAWRGLPPVEFVTSEGSPESWYLPELQGRIGWASSAQTAGLLNVVVNVAASPSGEGAQAVPSSGMAALLPFLKILSQSGSPAVSANVALLDLSRKRAVFQQRGLSGPAKDLDWARLKSSLADANTASIDLHSLAERHHDAQFFVSEVRKILRAAEKPGVLVVLTTPAYFESGEDMTPISVEALPDTHVVYVRYWPRMKTPRPFFPELPGGGRGIGPPRPGRNRDMSNFGLVDRLAGTLKPLRPKIFDVESPGEMTKVLKEIGDLVAELGAKVRP